jgi:hypothetical protein
MNGGGQSGLMRDTTGAFDFIGKTGTRVELRIGSSTGHARIAAAQYSTRPEVTNGDRIVFTVAQGSNLLVLNVVSPNPEEEEVQLLQPSDLALLASFKLALHEAIVSFTIYGS